MEPLITLYNNNNNNTIHKEKSPLDGNQKNIPQHSVFYLNAKRSSFELAEKNHQQLVDAAQYQHSHTQLIIL